MSKSFYNLIEFDTETLIPIYWDESPYDGEWLELKKGREQQAQLTQQQMDLAKGDQATRAANYAAEDPTLKQFESVGPGGMGTAASARYAADLGNINEAYGNARRQGLRSLATRGLSQAPTGAESSMINTANLAQAHDETGAFQNALGMTREDQLAALNARQGLQNIYNPNSAYQGASESAFRQSQMGSTLGDIGAGLAAGASLATVPLTGLGVGGYGKH